MNRRKPKSEIICRCNNISRETIENAIREGCQTLNEIFDATTAGVGPCGGSCRRKLKPMLDQYLENGSFPQTFSDPSQPLQKSNETTSANSQPDLEIESLDPKRKSKIN